jgi:GT2 family glycosyltransferase
MGENNGQEGDAGGPRLTFAIPYRSHSRWLIEAVESVLAQTSSRWLLRIYDDNPAEPLDPAILESYLVDPRIEYSANQTRLGMGGNWNQCLDRCSTELLTILHADDCLLPNYLQLMLDVFERDDSAWAAFCQAEIIDEKGRRTWSLPDRVKRFLRPGGAEHRLSGESAADALLRGNFIMCPTVCYRMERIGGRRFDSDWNMVLDLDFYLRVLLDGGALCGSDAVAYRYRRHAASQTARLNESLQRFEEEAALYRQYAVTLDQQGWHQAAATARRCHIVKLHLVYQLGRDMLGLRWRGIKEKMALLRRM